MKKIIKIVLLFSIIGLIVDPSYSKQKYITENEIKELESSGHIIPIGTNAWKTAQGLIIQGKDYKQLTRLEHIMKHSVDVKNRKKHSVFTISKAEIIDLMNSTWIKIKSGNVIGKTSKDKTVYTYKTDRVIGYLGGKIGKKKGYPKLKSVRLVIKNKSDVVTFFPF